MASGSSAAARRSRYPITTGSLRRLDRAPTCDPNRLLSCDSGYPIEVFVVVPHAEPGALRRSGDDEIGDADTAVMKAADESQEALHFECAIEYLLPHPDVGKCRQLGGQLVVVIRAAGR